MQADVYVWRYALLVVHARKEEEDYVSCWSDFDPRLRAVCFPVEEGECRLCYSHGGWIVDGFPVNRDQWSLLLEQGKHLPDQVVFLYDESPNGDLLIKRWYTANKAIINKHSDR